MLFLYTMPWSSGEDNSFYYVLNQALRSEDRGKVNPYFLVLRLLLEAINKLPPLKGTFVRGVKRDLSGMYQKDGKVISYFVFKICN